MFGAAPSFAGYSDSPISSLSEVMSAPKRARVAEAVAYTEVDTAKLTLNVREDEKHGKFLSVLLDGHVPHINLTPVGSLHVLYGFDMGGKLEPRSFNSEAAAKPNESLSLRVVVESPLLEALREFDEKCRKLYEAAGLEGDWMPLLAYPNKLNEIPDYAMLARLQICLKGDRAALKILDGNEVLKGAGWDFLKAQEAGHCGFRGANVKVAVRPRIWAVAGKCGVSLAATQLFVKPGEKPAMKDVFADDAEW